MAQAPWSAGARLNQLQRRLGVLDAGGRLQSIQRRALRPHRGEELDRQRIVQERLRSALAPFTPSPSAGASEALRARHNTRGSTRASGLGRVQGGFREGSGGVQGGFRAGSGCVHGQASSRPSASKQAAPGRRLRESAGLEARLSPKARNLNPKPGVEGARLSPAARNLNPKPGVEGGARAPPAATRRGG